ncbi:ead/Ea22-like family protein [Enterobacter hormaechei]
MSNIDKRALREAADAANKSSWGRWESYHPHKGARGYEVKVGVKAVAQHCLKVDSEFIAAANPATVLALLDELEAAEKRIAEQNKTLMASRSYVKSHAAGDGHAFGVLQAIDRAAGIGVKGE